MHKILFILLLGVAMSLASGRAPAETVLITGANQGIGLEFTKQYAARGWTVIATHRRRARPKSWRSSPRNIRSSASNAWT